MKVVKENCKKIVVEVDVRKKIRQKHLKNRILGVRNAGMNEKEIAS